MEQDAVVANLQSFYPEKKNYQKQLVITHKVQFECNMLLSKPVFVDRLMPSTGA